MKFYLSFLFSLLLSGALAKVVSTTDDISFNVQNKIKQLNPNLSRFATSMSDSLYNENLGLECTKVLYSDYVPCFAKMAELMDTVDVCVLTTDTACSKLLNEEINLPSDCQSNSDLKDMPMTLEATKCMFLMSCSVDEKGDFCPLTNTYLTGQSVSKEEVLEGTCSSEKCKKSMEGIVELYPSYVYFSLTENEVIEFDPSFINGLTCSRSPALPLGSTTTTNPANGSGSSGNGNDGKATSEGLALMNTKLSTLIFGFVLCWLVIFV